MSYYHELNLTREPFSNSPDPDFFYRTQDRVECLNLMEVHIRLKRGLCVLLGDIGTGKTTLCRQLLVELQGDEMVLPYLLLDPHFRSSLAFLQVLYKMILEQDPSGLSEWELKEAIKKKLLDLSTAEGKTVVLLIDEGQKLRHDGLELLRELLNYETNCNKLLQIIIFAQNEFTETLNNYPNFFDRISTMLYIGPFVFRETVEMIKFRIRETQGSPTKIELFSFGALWDIHKLSAGYPRKIVTICHKALLQLILDKKKKVTRKVIRSATKKQKGSPQKIRLSATFAVIVLLFLVSAYLVATSDSSFLSSAQNEPPSSPAAVSTVQPTASQTDSSPALQPVVLPRKSYPQPKVLGTIQFSKEISLGLLLTQIYGADSEKFRKVVRSFNPTMVQSEMVSAGTPLEFPPILQTPGGVFKGMCWIEVASFSMLQGACSALQDPLYANLPVSLLASFTSDHGLRFSLVLKRVYSTEELALEALHSLPAAVRMKTKIIRSWGKRAILYTTPDVWPQETARSAAVPEQPGNAS